MDVGSGAYERAGRANGKLELELELILADVNTMRELGAASSSEIGASREFRRLCLGSP